MQIRSKIFIRLVLLIYITCLALAWFKFSNISGTRWIIADSRQGGFWNINIQPFYTIRNAAINDSTGTLIRNLVVFIPVGILYPFTLNKKKRFYIYLAHFVIFDLVLENIQFMTMTGFFDADDILLNTIGFICSYIILIFCRQLLRVCNISPKNSV